MSEVANLSSTEEETCISHSSIRRRHKMEASADTESSRTSTMRVGFPRVPPEDDEGATDPFLMAARLLRGMYHEDLRGGVDRQVKEDKLHHHRGTCASVRTARRQSKTFQTPRLAPIAEMYTC
ncbi:uncharacterized protein LOC144006589 [Festucalex cinctus]